MITAFLRIIKYGVQNFVRNGWLSVATTAIMVMTLLVFVGLAMFDTVSEQAIRSVQDKIDISVYFREDVSEDVILDFEGRLTEIPEVRDVEYISQEKALEVFKERHQDDDTISQALAELSDNPLLASLVIKAHDPKDYALIDKRIKDIEEELAGSLVAVDEDSEDEEEAEVAEVAPAVLIDKVTFTQNQLVIERLTKIIDTFQNIGLGATLILALIAILITFNTIRLAIYSNRSELGIMRLVGAANQFINGPYLVTGILYGIVAAVVSLLLIIPIIKLADPYVMNLIPDFSLEGYFLSNTVRFLFIQLLVGALLGALSSAIAIRKYLKL